ncbi:RNase adapter RapZ [Granulosicoccaceae sp. 1_MG-2023]|nr:RNase adapter RapZ [Granulosicoccaceae sp. 1_MG-2023]
MRLIIVSGLSGAGKSVALHTLEDDGFYCIDNLPASLLPQLVEGLSDTHTKLYRQVAVGIDARSAQSSLSDLPQVLDALRERDDLHLEILFLETDTKALVTRYSETRRKHPLSLDGSPLLQAIETERALLDGLRDLADLKIDTTNTNVHQLRQMIHTRLLKHNPERMSIQFQSFGFKHGVPNNTDFIFDVRCLPNPHWDSTLRPLTGNDKPVQDFLGQHETVEQMYAQIQNFLETLIPLFQAENRAYLTVSIGCTGGRHRSVYLTNRLAAYFSRLHENVSTRHREL